LPRIRSASASFAAMGSSRSLEMPAPLETLMRFLRHLGWSRALGAEPRLTEIGSGGGASGGSGGSGASAPGGSAWISLELRDPQTPLIAVAALAKGHIASPRRLYSNFEDFGTETRRLLSFWRDHPPAPEYAILTDGQRTLLLDVAEEEILAAAEEAEELGEKILPHLDYREVSRGSLRTIARKPAETLGQDLRGWIQRWMSEWGGALDAPRAAALDLMEALLLARQAERLGFAPGRQKLEDWAWISEGAGKASGNRAAKRNAGSREMPEEPQGGAAKPERGSAGTARTSTSVRSASQAIAILRRIWSELESLGYLPRASSGRRGLIGWLELPGVGLLPDRCLASLSRLSTRRFSAEVFAAAFADDELRQRSWGAMVTGAADQHAKTCRVPENPPAWLQAPLELDLDTCGCGPVMQAFAKIVEGLCDYNLRQRAAALRGERTALQLDLFAPEPDGLTAALNVADPVGHGLGNVLRVRTRDAARARMMRFVLASMALELHSPAAPKLEPIPDLRLAVPDTAPGASPTA